MRLPNGHAMLHFFSFLFFTFKYSEMCRFARVHTRTHIHSHTENGICFHSKKKAWGTKSINLRVYSVLWMRCQWVHYYAKTGFPTYCARAHKYYIQIYNHVIELVLVVLTYVSAITLWNMKNSNSNNNKKIYAT